MYGETEAKSRKAVLALARVARAPAQEKAATQPPPISKEEARLKFRRTIRGAWMWELVTSDGHVCNSSAEEFDTRPAAELDAASQGQSLDNAVNDE